MPHKDDQTFKRGRYGRTDFLAFSDKYTNLMRIAPLQSYMDESLAEVSRLRIERYRKNWNFYLGKQYNNEWVDGEKKIVLNFCQPVIDKSAAFLMMNLWSHVAPKGNEGLIAPVNYVWDVQNSWEILAQEMALMGGITGDCFFQVTYEEISEDWPNGRVRLIPLNSSYVHPIFDPLDKDKKIATLIQFPITIQEWDEQGNPKSVTRNVTYSQYITPDYISVYHDSTLIKREVNLLRRINVVHIKNMVVPGAAYGMADIDGAHSIQEEINSRAHDMGQIINYHATPTTCIFGAKLAQIEKGANKVWTFPKDAKVENLALQGDLAASMAFLERLKTTFHEFTKVPKHALGGEPVPISNTSGVALHIQYMPLMEKTHMKQNTYGAGIMQINELILRWLELKNPDLKITEESPTIKETMAAIKDNVNKYRVEVKWPFPLPKDELIHMQLLAQKLEAGLESHAGALKELGVEYIEDKMGEIADDKIAFAQLDTLAGMFGAGGDDNLPPEPPPEPPPSETNIGGIIPGQEKYPEGKKKPSA